MWLAFGLLCLLSLAACSSPRADFGAHGRTATVVAGVSGSELFGSGFAIDTDHVVTAAHVVRGLTLGDAVTLVYLGKRSSAVLVGRSAAFDLAVLRQTRGTVPMVVGSAAPQFGLAVTASGTTVHPDGPRLHEVGGAITARCVRIPGFGTGSFAHLRGATPGFSGGPVLDGEGRLVGMLVALDQGGQPRDAFAPVRAMATAAVGRRAFLITGETVRREASRLTGGSGHATRGNGC